MTIPQLATIKQYCQLHQLDKSCFKNDNWTLKEWKKVADKTYIICEQDVIIASILVLPQDEQFWHDMNVVDNLNHSLYIEHLVVDKDYRGKGLAKMLLQDKNIIPDDQDIFLHVKISNISAINLYKKLGYEIREEMVKYYHDENALFMWRKAII